MEYGHIRGMEKPVSRLIMGTTSLDAEQPEETGALLDGVYAMGINTFDTALIYGHGSEIALGRWIRERSLTEKVNVMTKGAHPDGERRRVHRKEILADCAKSLERLGLPRIDGYLLHRDDPEVPVGEIVDTLQELKEKGWIQAFGGSNWTHERLAEANAYAERHGLTPFTMSSPHYSLAEQTVDPWGGNCVSIAGPGQAEARAYYRRTGMPVLCYASLCHGFLSGRLRSDEPEKAAEVLDPFGLKGFAYPENFRRLQRCEEIAEKYGVKVPQVALAWLLHQQEDVYPIVGVSRAERMRENLEAMRLPLTDAEIAYLNLEKESPAD